MCFSLRKVLFHDKSHSPQYLAVGMPPVSRNRCIHAGCNAKHVHACLLQRKSRWILQCSRVFMLAVMPSMYTFVRCRYTRSRKLDASKTQFKKDSLLCVGEVWLPQFDFVQEFQVLPSLNLFLGIAVVCRVISHQFKPSGAVVLAAMTTQGVPEMVRLLKVI